MDNGKYGEKLIEQDIELYTLNMPQGKITWDGIKKLYKIVTFTKPEIVQTWMYHADLIGGIVAKLAGVKKIIWGIRHTTHDKKSTSLSTRIVTKLCAYLSYIIPTKIVSVSFKGVEVHQHIGYKKDIFEVIPNGYDISNIKADKDSGLKIRNEFNIEKEQILIGMVGRYNPQKNHVGFIQAMSMLNEVDFKCLFVGINCDYNNNNLLKQIKDYGLEDKVVLVGKRNDIPDIMNALDIHVLSSSYGEAFPNVVAEAMACGTPCIVTDVGDAAYIVGDVGWVVKPLDILDLSKTINKVIGFTFSKEWKTQCLLVRSRIENEFTIKKVFDMYYKLWIKVQENSKE